jgi:predicted nucleotidyltransferase
VTGEIYEKKAEYSRGRLTELASRLGGLSEARALPKLTIFGAGSYARLEASEYSDLDLFFLSAGKKEDVQEQRTKLLRLFGRVIEIADEMAFPKFSNDSEYLVLIHTDDILAKLGSRTDDHENYFTARMLLLLEGHCLYGPDAYSTVTSQVINSYFKDYPDHQASFQPMFLLNDICRYWKTLLLNYENKRTAWALPVPGESSSSIQERKTRHRVKNFKLKFSRMTTCFATIAAIGCYVAPVTEQDIFEITKLTPRERLRSVPKRVPTASELVARVLREYEWFLAKTSLSTDQLEAQFADKAQRLGMFERATKYGDVMFDLIKEIDASDSRRRLLRTLVI